MERWSRRRHRASLGLVGAGMVAARLRIGLALVVGAFLLVPAPLAGAQTYRSGHPPTLDYAQVDSQRRLVVTYSAPDGVTYGGDLYLDNDPRNGDPPASPDPAYGNAMYCSNTYSCMGRWDLPATPATGPFTYTTEALDPAAFPAGTYYVQVETTNEDPYPSTRYWEESNVRTVEVPPPKPGDAQPPTGGGEPPTGGGEPPTGNEPEPTDGEGGAVDLEQGTARIWYANGGSDSCDAKGRCPVTKFGVGDRVRTGPDTYLTIRSGAGIFLIGPNTSVAVTKTFFAVAGGRGSQVEFELTGRGPCLVIAGPAPLDYIGGEPKPVKKPAKPIAAVKPANCKGADFSVRGTGKGVEVRDHHGKLKVAGENGKPVQLKKGQQTHVAEDARPTRPKKFKLKRCDLQKIGFGKFCPH